MRAGLLILTLIGCVYTLPYTSEQNVKLEQIKESLLSAKGGRNSLVESVILEVLEQIRSMMISGTDSIPPLDPLVVPRIHLNDQVLPIPGAFITINNLVMRGVSTFRVDSLQLSSVPILRQRLAFDIVIPAINVQTGRYDLSMRVFGGDIYGSGDMSLRIVNSRVRGNIVIGTRITANGIFLTIHSAEVRFGLDAFEPVITGMFHDEASSQFVSKFLANLIPEALDMFETEITNFLSTTVMVVGNRILADLDIGSLLP